jgi:hypothetical protein
VCFGGFSAAFFLALPGVKAAAKNADFDLRARDDMEPERLSIPSCRPPLGPAFRLLHRHGHVFAHHYPFNLARMGHPKDCAFDSRMTDERAAWFDAEVFGNVTRRPNV